MRRVTSLVHFERLLSELSAKYINMPVGQIESAVRKDFGRLASLLGGDSSNFHFFDAEKQDWMTQFELSEKVFLWVHHKEFNEQLRALRSRPDFAEKMQYMFEQWEKGRCTICPCPDRRSKKAEAMEQFVRAHGISSFVSVPIFAAERPMGAIIVAAHGRVAVWPQGIIPKVRLFGEILVNALVRKRSEEALRAALLDVQQLKDQIHADYVYLTEEINLEQGFPDVVGNSQIFRQILLKVRQVARTNASVLLLGETGSDKGVMARAIHNASRCSHRPLIQVNCAALAPGLIEVNSSVMRKAPLRGRWHGESAVSRLRTARRFFSTRSATFPSTSRQSSFASCRKGNSSGWGRRRP